MKQQYRFTIRYNHLDNLSLPMREERLYIPFFNVRNSIDAQMHKFAPNKKYLIDAKVINVNSIKQ